MHETSKAHERRIKNGHFEKYLNGHGIDIGCGDDKLNVLQGDVDGWDVANGDAMAMSGIENEKYDFVYSSHCLEHMVDVELSLYNWSRILKTGGHLYIVVPDFVLYEKMKFPSMFNKDHKNTFSINLKREQVKRDNHFHADDIISLLKSLHMETIHVELEDDGYDYNAGPKIDQTRGRAMAQILVIAKKTSDTPLSQMGADDWVLSLYKKGFFVDAGCFDGEDLSNTYKLEKHGWKGICIDAYPKNFSCRPNSKVVQAVLGGKKDEDVSFVVSKCPEISGIHKNLSRTNWENWVEREETRKTVLLQDILDHNNAPNFIEYLNLDIEGSELEVLMSLDHEKYKFGCISVEHNFDEPKRTMIRDFLKTKDYVLHGQVKADDWFVIASKSNSNEVLESKSSHCKDKNYKIGLCMIVKNEAKIICRCLDSVKPLIDFVCIIDTGSTDETIQTIKSWMEKNSIDGIVEFEPWKDFSHNRSFALNKLRSFKNVEYALMIDADEILEYEDDFNPEKAKQNMCKDLYNITCRYGNISYVRTSITKNKKLFFYKGVVHEFLECSEPIDSRDTLDGVFNVPLQDSARNQTNKYENDIKAIEQALKSETDPFMISRYKFYLAQSYRDLGDMPRALTNYLERTELGFWSDEIYISYLQAARIKENLQYPDDDVIQTYMRAHEIAPHRIEAIHGAARYCRTHSKNHQAYILSKWGQSMPVRKDGLFVEPWIWDYGIYDEVSISSYWSGHYEDGIKVTKELLNKIPEAQRPRVEKNLKYLEDIKK
jgi:glycosyltransferase involved in cell wall biosynthesis